MLTCLRSARWVTCVLQIKVGTDVGRFRRLQESHYCRCVINGQPVSIVMRTCANERNSYDGGVTTTVDKVLR